MLSARSTCAHVLPVRYKPSVTPASWSPATEVSDTSGRSPLCTVISCCLVQGCRLHQYRASHISQHSFQWIANSSPPCIPHRCYGVTSWQPCLNIRVPKPWLHRVRHQHATAAAAEQATSTTEAPKTKRQQQKANSKQKGGKADKKSELAVTPKSVDFARYCTTKRSTSTATLHMHGSLHDTVLQVYCAACDLQESVRNSHWDVLPQCCGVQVVHRHSAGSTVSQQRPCQWHHGDSALWLRTVGVPPAVPRSPLQGDRP